MMQRRTRTTGDCRLQSAFKTRGHYATLSTATQNPKVQAPGSVRHQKSLNDDAGVCTAKLGSFVCRQNRRLHAGRSVGYFDESPQYLEVARRRKRTSSAPAPGWLFRNTAGIQPFCGLTHPNVHTRRPKATFMRGVHQLWLCLVLGTTLCAPAAIAAKTDPYASIRADIEKEIAAGRLTGISVALVRDGSIIWEEGFGWADREARRPATAHTAFSVASTTKPFTTIALALLAAEGKVNLDRPANDYLGAEKIIDSNGPSSEATLRRLATHSSGLPTFFGMYFEGGPKQPTIPELIRDYGHLVAPAGERYEYSNLGMGILADIVARQSGQEFGEFLRQRVLQPLEMRDSFFDTDVSRHGEMAVRYTDEGMPLPFYVTATPGSGQLYASAHDLARFAMLHLGGKGLGSSAMILDRASLDDLHRPRTPIAPNVHYGMGWQIYDGPASPKVLHHGGGQSGVKAEFVLIPSAGAAAIVLSNRRGAPGFIHDVRDRMLKTIVHDWAGLPVPPPSPAQPLPMELYGGRWRGSLLAQGRKVPVVLDVALDGSGTLSVDGGPAHPIADLGLVDGLLSGDSHGNVGSPDTRREHLDQLSLGLKLRGNRIDGELVAWRKTSERMAMFPYWTQLERAKEP